MSLEALGKLEDVTLEQFKPFAEAVRAMVKEELGEDIAKEADLDYLYTESSESKKRKRDDNAALHAIADVYREKGYTVMSWKEFYAKHGAELIRRMKEAGTYDPEDSQNVLEFCAPTYFPKILID